MRLILKKNGFTVLEAVVAVAIISFVLVSTISILINVQNQNRALELQISATSFGESLRDEIQATLTVTSAPSGLVNLSSITSLNQYSSHPFYEKTTVSFVVDNTTYSWISIMYFTVEIEYLTNRYVKIEGVLYELK